MDPALKQSPKKPTPTKTTPIKASPAKHAAEEWWGGWSGSWSWHEPSSWYGWDWATESWCQQDWGGSWASSPAKQSRSPKNSKTPKKFSPKPAPAAEQSQLDAAAEQSQQARAMLQRPLTSIMETMQVDEQAKDVEKELEEIMDDVLQKGVSDDKLALRSMDSASTLALGSGLSSDTLGESSQPAPATPALSRRSSGECSEATLQQYLDEVYADSHRGRSPRERGLCKLEEEVDGPMESKQRITAGQPTASNPEVTASQPMASNPEVTSGQPVASNPQVTSGQPVKVTGTIPETTDQPVHSKQQGNQPAQVPGTILETADQPMHSKQQGNQPAQVPSTMVETADQPMHSKQQGNQPAQVPSTMAETADQPVHSKQQESTDSSWRCDKYGHELKPTALYARFYRSGRSHALSIECMAVPFKTIKAGA